MLKAFQRIAMLVAAPLGRGFCKFCEIALERGGAFVGVTLDFVYFHGCDGIGNCCSGEDEDRRSRLF